MTTWKDNSSSFNGKMLKTIVKLSDTEIVEASLYYSSEYEEYKNSYGVTERRPTGTNRIVLNASAMRKSGEFYVGGLGHSYTMSTGHKRKTLKDLEKVAAALTESTLEGASRKDFEPTLVY